MLPCEKSMNVCVVIAVCAACFFLGAYRAFSAPPPIPSTSSTTSTPSATPASVGQPSSFSFHLAAKSVLPPSSASPQPSVPPPPATLRWTNGESLPGDFLEATGTTATWKSPLFEEPIVLDWNVIDRVDWPAANTLPEDPFIISLRDGSSIYADLVSITGSSVFIHASRYGDAELKRSEVLSARRIKGDSLLLAGPTGDAGWQATDSQQNGSTMRRTVIIKGKVGARFTIGGQTGTAARKGSVDGFTAGPGGTLETPYWNRAALLDMQMAGAVDVEFHLHSTRRPDFRLSIEDGSGTSLRIETWDDALVAALSNETDFKLIRKIDDTERNIGLRFCWDSRTRHCTVYTPSGDLITDWLAPQDNSTAHPGLMLQNKGTDLSLDYLRIRKWDGTPPPKIDVTRPRVELANGGILEGEVLSGSAGSVQVRGGAEASGTTVPLAGVDALVFSTDSPNAGPAEATLSYADGTYLDGRITSIKDGCATLATTFSTQPLAARLDGLRQLLVEPPGTANLPVSPAKLDTLRIQDTTYHGTLVATGNDSPQWLPAGAAAPVTPSRTLPYEIARYFPEDAKSPEVPALFHTRAGDVLPGNLHAIDRSGVDFDSGITEATRLPATALKAIQFGASAGGIHHGVNDPTWRILKGDDSKVRRNGDSLEMDAGTAIGNASAMQSSEIRFRLSLQGNIWAARLRMFCAGADPAKSTNILFASNGNEINCGPEGQEGQFDEPRIQATATSGTVAVRLVIQEKGVEIYLNGISVAEIPVPPSSRAGAGLIIEPAGIWGNSPQGIKLNAFSTLLTPGTAWLPDVAADAKAQALTIPRFQRNDPPVHALIAANGDILRGEIEGATNSSFGFRAGMEELTVPRDRVKAVVWLGKPLEAQPSPTPPNPAQQILEERLDQRIRFGTTNLQSVTGFLQSMDQKLKFKLPKETTGIQFSSFSIGGETVAAALDRICAAGGLTYHVDDKGVIVLESAAAGAPPETMVRKIYWLKPGSLPAGDPPDKILAALAAKGVLFPPRATAAWDADSAQLSVQNTPDNQTRLAQVLAPDFACAIGSPTHWLVLTTGARLALAVDKFGAETITGWHPLYGRCTIPTADVALVRTSPIEPSAAMKSIGDWQTVYAPEPILPEAGGESSALVGKPAPDFKLPLVDGSTFQLAHEKGKIVVLDFWATWCGPCVRSLPGLIQSMSPFPPDRVTFIGVDQDEPAATVKQFLETRGWKLNAALDDGSRVGQQYGADAIPHTVIIGTDGKIAWVKTSYIPGEEDAASKEVNQLLAAPTASTSR